MNHDYLLDDWLFFDDGLEIDHVLSLLLEVGDLDFSGSGLFEFLDLVLDVVDDFFGSFIVLDDSLDVVGDDLGFSSDGSFSDCLNRLSIFNNALLK